MNPTPHEVKSQASKELSKLDLQDYFACQSFMKDYKNLLTIVLTEIPESEFKQVLDEMPPAHLKSKVESFMNWTNKHRGILYHLLLTQTKPLKKHKMMPVDPDDKLLSIGAKEFQKYAERYINARMSTVDILKKAYTVMVTKYIPGQ